jgi:hypothetical protein
MATTKRAKVVEIEVQAIEAVLKAMRKSREQTEEAILVIERAARRATPPSNPPLRSSVDGSGKEKGAAAKRTRGRGH